MPNLIYNRFKVIRQLGKGGMGTVYLVEDLLQENRVLALKVLRAAALEERRLAQFKQEFAAQGQLSHPNLVAVYDFFAPAASGRSDQPGHFFTMEFVPGEDLLTQAEEIQTQTDGGPEFYAWVYDKIVQVCRALQYIHSHGFIHYDVKPRNIRIMPEGQVKLMDFGLIGNPIREGKARIQGTADYIAPEMIRGRPVDHRADLYALGVSLYEIVTGRQPFSDLSSSELLEAQVEMAPDLPDKFVPELPEGLQRLIMKLLAKDPARRYQSASQVIEAINAISGLNFPIETKEIRLSYLRSSPMVGREAELAVLDGLLERSIQGQGQMALITGPEGIGKHRLARELRLRAQMQQVMVCEAICDSQSTQPYQPWGSIFSQLISLYQAEQSPLLPLYGPALGRLIPVLEGQLGPDAKRANPPAEPERLLEAAARFVTEGSQPLVIILENLHEAGPEALALLEVVGQRLASSPVLVCGVSSDEPQPGEFWRPAKGRTHYTRLQLAPLSEAEVDPLLHDMLGYNSQQAELPNGLLPYLMEASGGKPGRIVQILHDLIETERLSWDGNQWSVGPEDEPEDPEVPALPEAQALAGSETGQSGDTLTAAAPVSPPLDLLARVAEANTRLAEANERLAEANRALERQAVHMETSSQVGRQATSILDLNELLIQVVRLIQEGFGYYHVSIWMISDHRDYVAMQAGAYRDEPSKDRLAGTRPQGRWTERHDLIPMYAASIIVNVCRTGLLRRVDDVLAAPDFMFDEDLPETRSELTLPLRMGSRMIGALDIQADLPAAFWPEDVLALQTLADQIAIAIRNAELYKAEQNRRLLAEALEQAGRELSSSLNLREVPGRILDQLARVVPYERGAVLVSQPVGPRAKDRPDVAAQRGFLANGETAVRLPEPAYDLHQEVCSASSPILIEDIHQERHSYRPAYPEEDDCAGEQSDASEASGWAADHPNAGGIGKSWLGVPLIVKDLVTGTIVLTRCNSGAFRPEDAMLASAFAIQAAIALENARLYDEITRFNEQLESMVRERTEELDKAYRTLERLDRTKADFIEVAAHELRTPLTVIKGYTEVARSLPDVIENPELNPLMEAIMQSADRLHEVINSMLDVSKIDSQTLRLHWMPVNLAEVIGQVAEEFADARKERRITLETTGLDDLPPVSGDRALLFKVFYHLVINAIKFTPDGGRITIRGQRLPADTAPDQRVEAIEILVQDTGIGIDPNFHELIFEKFFQTGPISFHSTGRTKFKGGGPGLGLAVVRGIVAAHGGKIWVESSGQDEETCPGSQFHVALLV